MSIEGISGDRRLSKEQEGIVARIEATMLYMADDGSDAYVPWLEWQANAIMDGIGFKHFTSSELAAFVGLIGPIFGHVLGCEIPPEPAQLVPPSLRLV